MGENDDVLTEIIPFIQDLIPGIPAALVLFLTKVAFFIFVCNLFAFIVFGLALHFKRRISAKRYLKNLPVSKDLEKIEPELRKKLFNLVRQCVVLGSVIDSYTNRKSNSKKVSMIVFSLLKDKEPLERILFYAAAMVYDAGYLEFKQSLFHSEVLSRKEEIFLRTHVARGLFQLDFVPYEYKSIFWEAVFFHHENQNGTGFPDGLNGDKIPYVARLIHLTEDYVSLVRQAGYKKSLSRKKALDELKKVSFKYDPELLLLLEKILLTRKK